MSKAYSIAVATSEELGDALAQAEAAIARAVINSVDEGADWAAISRKLKRVRPYCRELRDALGELNKSESADNVDRARANCRDLRAVFFELTPSAAIPFYCDQPLCNLFRSPRTTCWLNHLKSILPTSHLLKTSANDPISVPTCSPAQAIQQSGAAPSSLKSLFKDVRVSPSLLRQTIDVFVLVLAYLQYFFIDVQLQILSLPSIFP